MALKIDQAIREAVERIIGDNEDETLSDMNLHDNIIRNALRAEQRQILEAELKGGQ